MAYIPFGIGKCYVLHKEKLAKNNCNRSQCKTHWRRKVVVYLQKHSVNSFYKFKLIFSDFIPSLYHSLILASIKMHVHRWSAQNQSRQAPSAVPPSLSLLGCSQWWWQSGFCPGLLCHLQPAASIVPFFACEFCLLGALWILGDFFPLLYVFSHFGCLRPLPLLEQGEGVRCDLVAILQLSEHGFSCGRSPVLGLSWVLALRGVNSTCTHFYCC